MNQSNLKLILRGLGASAGIARGKVRIIKNDGSSNFREGEILVAKITDPSMVMMMSRAAAIITDLGGLTSHPCIVSREMGIPCIVGTKIATTSLKDGMEIIVDGAKGEIYITEKNYHSNNNDENKNKDYNDMLESYRQAYSVMDGNTFADTDFRVLDPLIAGSWTDMILETIEAAKNKNLSYKEIAKLMHCPNVLRSAALFDMFMASHSKQKRNNREKIADFYINSLGAICLRDPFSLGGTNLIHNDKIILDLTKEIKPANREIAKKLGRLVNACYYMGYSLFGDMNPMLVYENYGPYYAMRDGRKYLVIIKEFKNMRPTELWPESCRLPINKIKVVCLYENVKFSIDAITHTNYKGDVINNLKYYAIYADGKLINAQEAENIAPALEKYSDFIWFVFKKMDEKKFKLMYLYQKAYIYINLRKKLGLEWKPNKRIINDMLNNPIKKWPDFKDEREKDEYFLKIADPRTDFSE